ncbi:hypothetical protein G3O08_18540 [Cryomorpha ignava]|uniref:Response regulatory domain-containing protein n=1 Tax=Cryomorpha ignava TaxID=101383 RepID=A0A7K3WVH5_9FLAO|nr:hypothetical protein [Cryomorpha ignava]NEN25494.1 hypothetical protein [Cryomorpha ignava]
MKKRIDSVLLIDSNKQSAHINEEMIKATNLVGYVAVAYNAQNAVSYLKQRLAVGKDLPNIILLDINLPGVSSWDFLEIFETQFVDSYNHEIYLMSNDSNTKDVIKGSMHSLTQGVVNLPIIDWEINQILVNYSERYELHVA